MKTTAPTIKDVARVAGVSQGTVSKVINGRNVRPEYKVKVERAIDELGYTINYYARGLKISKTNAVALIIPNTLEPFYASFAYYVESSLYKHNYKLTLCCSNGEPEKEAEYLKLVQMNKVDGIIALTYSDIEEHMTSNIPLVVFDRLFVSHSAMRVSSDNFSGGVMAAEKFFELGCTSPAFVRVRSRFPGEPDKRKDGFLYACERRGVTPIVVDLIEENNETAVKRLVEENRDTNGDFRFDCIFCNSDILAFTAKNMLIEMGCRIPEDVQIIGFDGARYFNLPDAPLYVSSIVQPTQLLADKCVELVLLESQDGTPSLTQLPVKFEYGGTTKRIEETAAWQK